jgi:hypothetical protein
VLPTEDMARMKLSNGGRHLVFIVFNFYSEVVVLDVDVYFVKY